MTYTISPEAEDDLVEIAVYTVEKWGFEQWERYLESLLETFARIGQFPTIGRPFTFKGQQLRVFRMQEHAVYYRVETDGVTILSIVHDRTDGPLRRGSSQKT